MVSIIQHHNVSAGPLFLYIATQDTHGPDQVPARYANITPPLNFLHNMWSIVVIEQLMTDVVHF